MQFKRGLVCYYVVSALEVSVWFHVEETTSRQKIVVLSALYIKQLTNIIKYKLYTNILKNPFFTH